MEVVHGDKGLKMRAIYTILKKVKTGKDPADLRGRNTKKNVRTGDLITAVTVLLPPPLKKIAEQTLGTLLRPMGQLVAPSAASSKTV